MNSLNQLQHTLIGPDATDAGESRREYMTRVVFVMMGIVLCAFTLVIAFGWGVGAFGFEGVAIMLLMDVPIATGWWLARHGHWRLARHIPVSVTFGLALYGTYFVGLVTTLVLFYVLAILLAAMLYGGRAQWIVLGSSILTHLVVGWSHTRDPVSNLLEITIMVSGSFIGIALLQWLSTNQLQRALASARATAVELQTEVNERKRAEEALRESQDKYRQLFDLESDAIVLVDSTTGQILEANAAASALYGYDREEWLTQKNTDVSAQPDETRRVTVEGETRIPVRYHRRKDGTVFPVEITASHFTWQGRPAHIAAIRDITQRKQAEEALRESERKLLLSEEHLRATLDYAPIGMATSDRNGRFLSVNRGFARMLDYSQEELCHMTFVDITAPGDVEESRANVQALWNGDIPSFQMEKKYLRKDGTVIDAFLSATLVYDRGGQPLFAVAMINDITERVKIERELANTKILLQSAFEQTPVPMVLVSAPDGIFRIVNPACFEFLGVEDEPTPVGHPVDTFSQTWQDFDSEGKRVPWAELPLALALQGITTRNKEMVALRKDGTRRWEMISAAPIYNDAGELIAAFVVFPDITERKRAEEALRRSETFLDSIIEHSPHSMWISDDQGTLIRLNQACRDLLHLRNDEVIGKYNMLQDNIVEEQGCLPLVRQVFEKGETVKFSLRYDSSQLKHLELEETTFVILDVTISPVVDASGRVTNAIIQHVDVTERKQAEEALREERALLAQRVEERTAELRAANAELAGAIRLKDEFLANMSHELRTPLNAILGLSESLQEHVYGPLNDKQRMTLHTIEESGRHLLSLINDILDLSKIGADKLELQVGWTSVESVCQASLAFIKQPAHKKKIGLSYTFDNAVTVIQADERRLKQILVNLLGNAVKFTPEGGKVGLEVVGDVERQALHLTVWDTGIGIRQGDMARLFQPFVQLDASLSRQYSGTGLGLALVQQLTEMHGGSVKVESEVGKGSRFTISLPWREPREGPRRESGPATQTENISAPPDSLVSMFPPHPVKILVVEDNEEGLYTLMEYLPTRGYAVVAARNGVEAIEQARIERPTVIVMDIQMPGMDGLEAICRIRADANLRTIPIIALTALAMPGDRERCLEAGANEYLSKPVSMKALVKIIETQLQQTGDPTAD